MCTIAGRRKGVTMVRYHTVHSRKIDQTIIHTKEDSAQTDSFYWSALVCEKKLKLGRAIRNL
jgi:hypothetical protein